MSTRAAPFPWLKPAVFVGSLAPLAAIAARALHGELGPNPIAEVLNQLGLMALVFLVASLGCTPLKTVCGWTWGIRIRRMLGLFAFSYAVLHAGTYVVLDQSSDTSAIIADVVKRPFIQVGFVTFAILFPLALTSTGGAVRRLGYARWKQLHRLAYVAGALGVVHFFWRVKKDVSEPLAYGAVLGLLFLLRFLPWAARRIDSARAGPPGRAGTIPH